jgi:hypothetical protein
LPQRTPGLLINARVNIANLFFEAVDCSFNVLECFGGGAALGKEASGRSRGLGGSLRWSAH